MLTDPGSAEGSSSRPPGPTSLGVPFEQSCRIGRQLDPSGHQFFAGAALSCGWPGVRTFGPTEIGFEMSGDVVVVSSDEATTNKR